MVSEPQAMIAFLPELPQISVWPVNPSRLLAPPVLDPSETFDNRLIVDGNRNGSRSVRCDDGSSELHPRGVVDGGAHGLLSSRFVEPRFCELFLDAVQRVRVHVSVDVRDANSSV